MPVTFITVPIYFCELNDGERIVDEENTREEFEQKLKEVIKNNDQTKYQKH